MFFEKRVIMDASGHDVSLEGWSQRYSQIGRGRYTARIEIAALDGITITREWINRAVTQETVTPAGTVSLIFPIRAQGGWRVNGRDEANGMTALREGETELLTVVGEDSELIVVTVPVDRLGFGDHRSQVRSRHRIGADSDMTNWLTSILFFAETNDRPNLDLNRILPFMICERLMDLYPGLGGTGVELKGNRGCVDLFRRARAILSDAPDAPVSLVYLSQQLKTPVDRLRLAILHCTGMSCATWLHLMRLEGARRELMSRHSLDLTVTDIAMRWGFFHLGRFSHYYCRQYGEAPSITQRH